MIRTFLAVELDENLRKQTGLLQQDLRQRLGPDLAKGVRISWVHPSSMHLTVKFLGDTDEQLVDRLREGIESLTERYLPICIPLERLGVFPRAQQPRVLWVGPAALWDAGEDAKRLASLHRAAEACCQSFGFAPDDRPLSPHLTLARIKEGERQVGQALARSGLVDRPLALGALSIAALVMMKSELRPGGSNYTRLWQARLGTRES